MTRPLVLLPLLLGSLLLPACGAKAGDACKGSVYTCASEKEALECQDSVWRTLPCRGPGGCNESGSKVVCDLVGDVAGDACASSVEGQGLCAPSGKAVLECRQGTLVMTRTCSTCTTSSTQVTCQP